MWCSEAAQEFLVGNGAGHAVEDVGASLLIAGLCVSACMGEGLDVSEWVPAAWVCGSLDLLAPMVCMSGAFDDTTNAAAWLVGLGIFLDTRTGVEEELWMLLSGVTQQMDGWLFSTASWAVADAAALTIREE